MNKNSTDLKPTSNKEVPTSTCHECLHNLYLMVDNEASKEQEEYFNKHMEECLPCFNSYSLEKSVKEFLNKRIERKPVPNALIDTIKSKISLIV